MVMPKPDLTELTGGYRKTPVMQIGADIYCDTQLIALELERRYPQRTLFPGGSEGLCMALTHWSDQAFFRPGAALAMGTNKQLPESVLADRRKFFSFLDFQNLEADLPHFYSQFGAQLALVETMLSDGRPFLLGEDCSWSDILAYFPIWMARTNINDAERLLSGYPVIGEWEARVNVLGHGERHEMQVGEAHRVAQDNDPKVTPLVEETAFPALRIGDRVTVNSDDYGGVPVEGTLERLTHREIAVRRSGEKVGEVVVHFPRGSYRLEKIT